MAASVPKVNKKPPVYHQDDPAESAEEEDTEESGLLQDEQLHAVEQWEEQGIPWCPEEEPFEDFMGLGESILNKTPPVIIYPSEFTEFAFRMPQANGLGYEPFSFNGRRHMRDPYDTQAKRILLKCARQVEKSTMLGNKALAYCCMIPAYRVLYVSPSATQTKTFSLDRVKEPIETSPILKTYTTTMLSQNIFEKQFVNRSKITMRYAFLNADRTRGIPAYRLFIDELQDVLSDNIPVIEQCTSHAPKNLKGFEYSGTPKSLDNIIEYYWSGADKHGRTMSTQNEWVVPCYRHGGETGRYWNILSERNIGRNGLICEKCGELIDPMNERAQWARMVDHAVFESYRVSQLMVPWKQWDEILLDYGRYNRAQFYNEVLGISCDSGMRPITAGQIKDCCNPLVHLRDEALEPYRRLSLSQPIFAGLDHGTGENTYSVFTLGTYVESKFRIFFIHRFIGEDEDPDVHIPKVIDFCKRFNIRVLGSDYGGGYDRNNTLVKALGRNRVQKYQYALRGKKKVVWSADLLRWLVHRTELMGSLFTAIKSKHLELPCWEEFREPHAQDILNIRSEYNEHLRMFQYTHRPDKPDDSFHAILYCFMASMIMIPRPDIIAPSLERPHQGSIWGNNYSGPVEQGRG